MPEANVFVQGFGFNTNQTYAGFKIDNIQATENVEVNYHKYSYDIVISFNKINTINTSNNISMLKSEVERLIGQTHIIYGIRNPYTCTIDSNYKFNENNQNYIFTFKGHATR
jgi:hypothetical protein